VASYNGEKGELWQREEGKVVKPSKKI